MTAIDQLDEMLSRIAQTVGLTPRRPDESGVAAIGLQDGSVVHIAAFPDSDQLLIYAAAGTVPDDASTRLQALQRALLFNRELVGQHNGGMGLTADGREFVYSLACPAEGLTAEHLLAQVQGFVGELGDATRLLGGAGASAEGLSDSTAPGTAPAPPSAYA